VPTKNLHPVAAKAAATKAAGHDKPRSNAAPKKATGAKKPSVRKDRLSTDWLSAKQQEVKPKDKVRTQDGFVLTVLGRWSKRAKDGTVVPFITGEIVKAPKGAVASAKRGSKNRAVPASTVTHTR